jgi:hypothetical protein
MKFLELVRPINYQKKRELELELEKEKRRFKNTTKSAAAEFRGAVIEGSWFREHPIESAVLILLGGYYVARSISSRSSRAKILRNANKY